MTKPLGKQKKARSFGGCKGCKHAKRKCPEEHPQCSICAKLGLKCEYDLNFLFRCEMVDFSGHVSKAARITRSDPVRKQKNSIAQTVENRPQPHKIIEFEFIDESASLMFPSWSYDQTTSSGSPSPPAETPNSAFGMLLDAANANDSPRLQAMMTPPQSPESRSLMGLDETDAHVVHRNKQVSAGSLEFILN